MVGKMGGMGVCIVVREIPGSEFGFCVVKVRSMFMTRI